ncbi:MAG: PAS domain S-box protein [Sulfuricella denitrificans]|nr:PAS domain S-box protein [Sulfuricella denitrificans]
MSDIVFGVKGVERRIGFLAAAIFVLAVLVTGSIIFAVLAQQLRSEFESGMVRTLNDKAALFQHEIEHGSISAISIATRRPRLAVLMSAFNAGVDIKETRRELSMALDIIRPDMNLSALALYDVHGKLVAGSGTFLNKPFAVSLRKPDNAALLWYDGFYLAVTAAMQQNGVNIGTVRMEIPLLAMTAAFQDYRGSGETGETVLCAAIPDERLRCFPTRLHPQPFDVPIGGIEGKSLPMSLAIAGKSGIVTSLDYRLQSIFGAYRPLGSSGLGIAVKIDGRELRQPALKHLLWIVPFLIALLGLGFALLRWQVGPLVREMVNARARVHGIVDNSADGIVVIDELGVVESINYSAARIFGYPSFEVIGRNVNMLMPDPYRGMHDEGIRNYLRTGEAKVIGRGAREVQGQRKDGSVFPMELSLGEMMQDGKRLFIASIRDTSKLKQAHDELKSSFFALQVINEELEEAHAQLRKAEQDKDRQMDALADANVRMALFHSSMEQIHQADMGFSESGDSQAFYHSILCDIMSLINARYGAVGLFDASGKLQQFLTEGISEEEKKLIGPYPVGKGLLQAFYKENTITRVGRIADDPHSCGFPPGHPPMTSLLGVPLNVRGVTRGVIYLTDKSGGEPFTEQDEMLVEMLAREVEHILERGELVARLRDSNQDLTREREEQQSLIEKLHEAQGQLLQSEKMASIGQLAAGVAHEINNPIGYVYSNLGSLEKYMQDLFSMLEAFEAAEGEFPPESASLSRILAHKETVDLSFLKEDIPTLMAESKEGITRVKKIVQDLKDFSHVDEAEWQKSDLHHGLNSTLNIVWNELKYKAEVVKEYGELPEIECIPSQLNQVFMNLLVNAGHAIESQGTITIRTGHEGDQVWVEIADTGKGIDASNLKRIFEPFFTTKPVGKGTGLGLSLSYGIVTNHHGRIEVESTPGVGTRFRVWLPVRQAAPT